MKIFVKVIEPRMGKIAKLRQKVIRYDLISIQYDMKKQLSEKKMFKF
jgi:hypothetical protein